ncbi:MAG: DUF3782 domain-containing protein [Pyrobaculum sp.]
MDVEILKKTLVDLAKREPGFLRELIESVFDGKSLVELITKDEQTLHTLANAIAAKITIPLGTATKKDLEELRETLLKHIEHIEKTMVTKEEARQLATKEDIRRLEEAMVTKEEARQFATREELAKLNRKLDALGARWGVFSEETFRRGVAELLESVGYVVEKWRHFDVDGYVFGFPSEVELDILVRDGVRIAVEIKSSVERGDLTTLRKKIELYEKTVGKIDRVYILTYYIHDRQPEKVKESAKKLGIEIVEPEEIT